MKKELVDLIEGAEWRSSKATEGPWTTDDPSDASCGSPCTENGCHDGHPTGWSWLVGPEHHDSDPSRFAPNDAEFIAHAREDVPALCAAIRETDMLARENDKRARHAEQERDAFGQRIDELEMQREKERAAWIVYANARAAVEHWEEFGGEEEIDNANARLKAARKKLGEFGILTILETNI